MTISTQTRTYLFSVLGLVAALWLGWASMDHNLLRSCTLQEWPHLTFCGDPSTQSVAEQTQALRRQINANPGDSVAYTALATLTQLPDAPLDLDAAGALRAASLVAPNNVFVLRLRASRALQARQWPEAVDLLVRLARDDRETQAVLALGALVGWSAADAALKAALTAQIKTDGRWFHRVITNLPAAKVPVVLAMPLVNQALPLGLVSPELGQFLMRHLKASGYWLDAHALWIRLWNRPVSLLFNGEFEQGFIADGFDWEVSDVNPSRAGAQVSQPFEGRHGRVLQVEFTGRAIAQPLLRQHMLLPAGSYSFSAEFSADRLRSNEGLAWTFTCVATGKELARTAAMKDTRDQWQSMALELKVPADCGLAVALQLQTFTPYEAATGLRGQVQFDQLALRMR